MNSKLLTSVYGGDVEVRGEGDKVIFFLSNAILLYVNENRV